MASALLFSTYFLFPGLAALAPMQNFRNYYEILGVTQDASFEDIKRAYRQMARRYHPDMNPGDASAEEQFKLLGEAYNILSDSEKRAQYEEFSRFWKQKGFQGGRSHRGKQQNSGGSVGRISLDKINFGEFRDFNNFIDQLLNRRREPEPPSSESGEGNGRNPQRPPRNGRRSSHHTSTASGASQTSRGRKDAEANLILPLEKAYAGGRERIRLEDGRSLEVNMPAGMVTGQRIRLKGQGIGGGNLYLRIEVEPHKFFKLKGNDIYCRVPVTPSEAVLGGIIEVPTLAGWEPVTLPAGTQAGHRLRLSGKGYPIGQEKAGDQLIEIEVVIPSVLTDPERALYAELREMESFSPRSKLPV